MATVDLSGFGHQNVVENAASTLTLSHTAHSGLVVNTTVTSVLTLPAVVVGMIFTLRVGAPGITMTISPAALDLIAVAGAANAGVGADNKDLVFTNQPAGSWIQIAYASATGWAVTAVSGEFTVEG